MTQITHLTGNYLAVEIPQDASDIQGHKNCVTYYCSEGTINVQLPSGSYKFLFLSSQVTEGDLKEICPVHKGFGWRDYMAANGSYQWCASALKSFHSLLQSKNLTGTYAVMEILNK